MGTIKNTLHKTIPKQKIKKTLPKALQKPLTHMDNCQIAANKEQKNVKKTFKKLKATPRNKRHREDVENGLVKWKRACDELCLAIMDENLWGRIPEKERDDILKFQDRHAAPEIEDAMGALSLEIKVKEDVY
jgi:hypothetical protein